MGGSSWPVPEACRCAYDTYLADLGTSAFAASTQALWARYVRRFLRWVAEGGGDAQAVLTRREAWDQAVMRFAGSLATAAARPTIRGYRALLADCADRLGLSAPAAGHPGSAATTADAACGAGNMGSPRDPAGAAR